MILPVAATVQTKPVQELTSRTYAYDVASKKLLGYVDGLEAVEQAYRKLLDTERFAYEIYSINYGREFDKLFGQSMSVVTAILPVRLREALFSDDRTVSIPELTVTQVENDTLEIYCRVLTTQGEISLRKEWVS